MDDNISALMRSNYKGYCLDIILHHKKEFQSAQHEKCRYVIVNNCSSCHSGATYSRVICNDSFMLDSDLAPIRSHLTVSSRSSDVRDSHSRDFRVAPLDSFD